ncbi:MAG: YncE family protein [Armatimonadetes bacterium]|nr:YncE family protein [Armatimonadota bacterium]
MRSLLASLLFAGAAIGFSAPPTFAVTHKFALSGEGGWDCLTVDGVAHRLYISRGTRVQIMDTENGNLVGEITDTPGVHAIAINHKRNEGYISSGRDNSVKIFDLKTMKTTESVPVGQNPDVIMFDAHSNQVFSFNGRSNDATILDASTHKVVGTVAIGGKPEFAASDEKGSIFVNVEDTSEIKQIDVHKRAVVKVWSIKPGEEPSGLAFDMKGHRLISVCSNQTMVVSDSAKGSVVSFVPVGKGPDGAAWDPAWKLAFSPNGQDGTLTIVSLEGKEPKVVQTLETMRSARTIAYDPARHAAYLIAAEFDAPAPGQRRGKMKPGSAVILVVEPKR